MHSASTEAYFADTTYHPLNVSETIIMNAEGKAVNVLLLIKTKKNHTSRGIVVIYVKLMITVSECSMI